MHATAIGHMVVPSAKVAYLNGEMGYFRPLIEHFSVFSFDSESSHKNGLDCLIPCLGGWVWCYQWRGENFGTENF